MLSSAGPQPLQDEIAPGAVILRTTIDAADAPRVPAEFDGGSQLNGNGLEFNLIPAPGMPQQAIDGFQDAADVWSDLLIDDIIVNINIDFTTLGPGILGSASSTTESMTLPTFRTNLTADATSVSDNVATANLPGGSSFSIYTSDPTTGNPFVDNDGSTNNTFLDVNTSTSKAIGVRAAGDATVDANITFSDQFTWDFDRSNGISGGAFDFIGVAAHEIGHALGFRSGADIVDLTSDNGPFAPASLNGNVVSTSLDMFRFSTDSLANGTDIDMRADIPTKFFSIDGGTTQITTFSTGRFNGDGQQASHWKDNLNIGLMDPTAAPGEFADITNFDIQAMDVIGWDTAAPDDHGDDAPTATPISVPSMTAGDLENPGDVDFFSFSAIAGAEYNFATTLNSLGNSTLALYDTDGTSQLAFDDDSGPGLASLINWTAPAKGTYYLEVGESGNNDTGTYSLDVDFVDDHGNDSGSATPVLVPSLTDGIIEVNGDADYFSFTAVAGIPYKFETFADTLSDTTLTLYDTDGTSQLDFDDDGGTGLASLINWVAPAGGTYFVAVRGFGTETGSYDLEITNNDDHGNEPGNATPVAVPSSTAGTIEIIGDVDVFSFPASVGAEYGFATTLNTLGDSTLTLYDVDGVTQLDFDDDGGTGTASLITWTAPSSGTYFLKVGEDGNDDVGSYSLDVSVIDDHGDDDATARPIAVPSTTPGDLESAGDVDYFSFFGASGAEYLFETNLVTLADTTLTLYDTDGTTELEFDDDGGTGLASLINWTAPVDGTYFLKVADFGDNNTGTYDLQASLIDDHGDNAATASIISVPSIAPGNLEVAGDWDYFSFNGIMGIDYTFETHLITLTDTYLRLYDTDGVTQLAFDDDDGVGSASLIEWTAPADGTYYVQVADFGDDDVGTYTLESTSSQRVTVTGTTINGGSVNRSGIGTIDWTFSDPVTIASATSFVLFNHSTSSSVNMAGATLSNNGSSTVTLDLTGLASMPDGLYSLELPAGATAPLLAGTHTITFSKLSGDLTGDAVVNFDDTAPISGNFGASGSPYRDGDADGDGDVNFNDTTPVTVNFGVSLGALTYDFGDAPQAGTQFPTTLAANGARHVLEGNTLFLGASRDAEPDGQPNAGATGDGADEDGLTVGVLERGTVVSFTVESSDSGFVNVWIDFNQDGDWDDPDEHLFADVPVIAGSNKLDVAIPGSAAVGSTIARVRLTDTIGHSYSGLARSGEVEDYQLTVDDPAPDLPADADTDAGGGETVETLFGVPVPSFTTFDHPLSLFSLGSRSRPDRR